MQGALRARAPAHEEACKLGVEKPWREAPVCPCRNAHGRGVVFRLQEAEGGCYGRTDPCSDLGLPSRERGSFPWKGSNLLWFGFDSASTGSWTGYREVRNG
jgi:hypothetical protein